MLRFGAACSAEPLSCRSITVLRHDLLTRVQGIAKGKLLLVGRRGRPLLPLDIPVWPLASSSGQRFDATNANSPVSRDDTAEIIFTSGATADPKGVIIKHRNILANVVPVEREMLKYRKYARPFQPIRFLNLLPLSHMFGQAMATFIPPMLPGVVVFMRGYNPHEIVRQIHTRRISVLVCVPKILDVLREYVLRAVPEAARRSAAGHALAEALVDVSPCPPAVRVEVLGLCRRRRAAATRAGGVLGPAGLCRYPGIRTDGNGARSSR